MNKGIFLIIILAVIIVVLAGVLLLPSGNPVKSPNQKNEDIKIVSPSPNEEISSPLKITGIVNGNGWAGFEGQVGTVKLTDYKGNELSSGILKATTEWTALPANFEAMLNFVSKNSGPATLIFHNENPSGDSAKDKTYILPIKLK